jgi:hypothetical protein
MKELQMKKTQVDIYIYASDEEGMWIAPLSPTATTGRRRPADPPNMLAQLPRLGNAGSKYLPSETDSNERGYP